MSVRTDRTREPRGPLDSGSHGRRLAWIAALAAACACQPSRPTQAPRRYLAITHPALNRITFFDLDARRVAGVLPAQKLPHDLLLSPDGRRLHVVNSGAQCVTTYHLDSPELWREARDFMRRDTARTPARGGSMFGTSNVGEAGGAHPVVPGPGAAAPVPPPDAPVADDAENLNPDPVQSLPERVAEFHLTDAAFPDTGRAAAGHARTRAREHRACFDCHDRSLGAKPFALAYAPDRGAIRVVHLAGRNLAELDAVTLEIRRRIPIDVPAHYAPIEAWAPPGDSVAFVTCRDEIGRSRRGLIVVVDLDTGATLQTITAGIYPWHLLPDPTGRRLYVNNFQSSRISIVDVARREIVDSLVVQNGPAMMLLSKDGARLFVSCFYTSKVLVVDLATREVERQIAVGSNPTSLLLSPDGATLLVLCGGESTLELIDLATSTVLERHPLLFGAYAFQLVEHHPSGRPAASAGLLPSHTLRGDFR